MAKQYDDILLNDILPDSISDIIEIKNAANIIDPELLSVSPLYQGGAFTVPDR